jgi:hypothetical protein
VTSFQPIWYAPDHILVNTGRLDHGQVVDGIYDVAIDPQSRAYQGFGAIPFPDRILDYDFDANSGDLVLTCAAGPPYHTYAVRARRSGSSLAVVDTIIGSSWKPQCTRFVGSGADVIAYATNPDMQLPGFYFRSNGHSAEDSLAYAVSLRRIGYREPATGCDVANGLLVFGDTDYDAGASSIWRIDLSGASPPRAVAAFPGEFISVGLNTSGTCALVAVDDWDLPGTILRILDLSTGRSRQVDVETNQCLFPYAEHAAWNPVDNAFAFSAGGWSGEGDWHPLTLWIGKNASCP